MSETPRSSPHRKDLVLGFGAALVVTTAIAWVEQSWVLPPGTRVRILGAAIPMADGDLNALFQRADRFGLLAVPLVVAMRVGLVALMLQLAMLLRGGVVPLRSTLRAALWGYGAVMAQSAVRLWWLWRVGPENVGLTHLGRMLGSLPDLLALDPLRTGTLYFILSPVSAMSLVWGGLVWMALTKAGRVKASAARAAVLSTWLVVALFQTALLITGGILTGSVGKG